MCLELLSFPSLLNAPTGALSAALCRLPARAQNAPKLRASRLRVILRHLLQNWFSPRPGILPVRLPRSQEPTESTQPMASTKASAPRRHAYDGPMLSAKEFMLAVITTLTPTPRSHRRCCQAPGISHPSMVITSAASIPSPVGQC